MGVPTRNAESLYRRGFDKSQMRWAELPPMIKEVYTNVYDSFVSIDSLELSLRSDYVEIYRDKACAKILESVHHAMKVNELHIRFDRSPRIIHGLMNLVDSFPGNPCLLALLGEIALLSSDIAQCNRALTALERNWVPNNYKSANLLRILCDLSVAAKSSETLKRLFSIHADTVSTPVVEALIYYFICIDVHFSVPDTEHISSRENYNALMVQLNQFLDVSVASPSVSPSDSIPPIPVKYQKLQGRVTLYNEQGFGIIQDNEGLQYRFVRWNLPVEIQNVITVGTDVRFHSGTVYSKKRNMTVISATEIEIVHNTADSVAVPESRTLSGDTPDDLREAHSDPDIGFVSVKDESLVTPESSPVETLSSGSIYRQMSFSQMQRDFARLDKLFDDGSYLEYLISDSFSAYLPIYLPRERLEQALTCAKRLLYPENVTPVTLTEFQWNILSVPTIEQLRQKIKDGNRFRKECLSDCASTSLNPSFYNTPHLWGLLGTGPLHLLRNLSRASFPVNTYRTLLNRCKACNNELTPLLFLIVLFTTKGRSANTRLLYEYCSYIQNCQNEWSPSLSSLDVKQRLMGFPQFLILAFQSRQMPFNWGQRLFTLIVSVFLDCNAVEQMLQIISVLDAQSADIICQIVNFIMNYEAWEKTDFADLLNRVNQRNFVTKTVALLWGRLSSPDSTATNIKNVDSHISPQIIRILGWVAEYEGKEGMSEVLFYPSRLPDGRRISHIHKMVLLLNTLKDITPLLDEDTSVYCLGSFIANSLPEYFSVPLKNETDISLWNNRAEEYYSMLLQQIHPDDGNSFKRITKLFHVFNLDRKHEIQLQNIYADCFLSRNPLEKMDQEILATTLDEANTIGAYEVYCRVYQYAIDHNVHVLNEDVSIHLYLNALMEMGKYTERIMFLYLNHTLPQERKKDMIRDVFRENLSNITFSSQYISAISSELPLSYLVELFEAKLSPVAKGKTVLCLISLYIQQNEYLKALYLFSFSSEELQRYEPLLYQRFRGAFHMAGYIKDIESVSHYDVIETAFYSLNVEELMTFLSWAETIKIPKLKNYEPLHRSSFYFDHLFGNVDGKKMWTNFLEAMVPHFEQNSWMLCVTWSILYQKWGEPEPDYIRNAFMSSLDKIRQGIIFHNLLAYFCLYLTEHEDTELCRELLDCLRQPAIHRSLIEDNPCFESSQSALNTFCIYCMNEFKSTGNNVYLELLSILGGELNLESLIDLSEMLRDKTLFIVLFCDSYLKGERTEDMIQLLFNEASWSNLTFQESQAINLIRTIYTDNEILLYENPSLFCGEHELLSVKQDCMRILRGFPGTDCLREFHNSHTDRRYKLLVYSFVFGALYDEDIYHSFDIAYRDLLDTSEQIVFFTFLDRVYYAQLNYNSDFNAFYRRWRYLKLYLDQVLLNGAPAKDSEILSAMRRHGHQEEILDDYLTFKEDVNSYWNESGLDENDKKCFLYALMVGRMRDCILESTDVLLNVSPTVRPVIQRLIGCLDYREASYGLYNLSIRGIHGDGTDQSSFADIVQIAQTLSLDALNAVRAFLPFVGDKVASSLFNAVALGDRPSACMRNLMQIEDQDYYAYQSFLIPAICSRQFSFHIYGSLRASMVSSKEKKMFNRRYISLAEYMAKNGHPEATNVYNYLCALDACMNQNRDACAEILKEDHIFYGIPGQWQKEAELIRNYVMEAKSDSFFIPEKAMLDNSWKTRRLDDLFPFIRQLCVFFGVPFKNKTNERKSSAEENFSEMISKFSEGQIPPVDRIKMGLQILLAYPKKKQKERMEGHSIPSYPSLATKVGLLAVSEASGLPDSNKLEVIGELYDKRGLLEESDNTLFQSFETVIRRTPPLQDWCRWRKQIADFISEYRPNDEFRLLYEEILVPCAELYEPECSVERRYEEIMKISECLRNQRSSYAKDVRDAIQREAHAIENGVRIRISIENKDLSVDGGYVYFQVENIGNNTFSLSGAFGAKREKSSCPVVVIQAKTASSIEETIPMSGILDLRAGDVTGGRWKVGSFGEGEINVSIWAMLNDTLLCKVDAILEYSGLEPLSPAISDENRYNTDSPISDSLYLFGRDDKKRELERGIPFGKTVIFGPSRIGKTSLLNWVRDDLASTRGNVISVLFGGERVGKHLDYVTSFIDEVSPVPYQDDKQMSEYLLVDTILTGLQDQDRRRLSDMDCFPQLWATVENILQKRDVPIRRRYSSVSEVLKKYGMEIWILLDEFQQVVEKWTPKPGSQFVTTCEWLGKDSNIKLIVCGSDGLLQHMILEDNSVWRTQIKFSHVQVEALTCEPFKQMIQEEPSLQNTGIHYSEQALDALFVYTGGVALYGKYICNLILDFIQSGQRTGDTIYSVDVAEAAQKLLDQQSVQLTANSREGIINVYDAVTNNLDRDTDMLFLQYMAKYLLSNYQYRGFPRSVFTRRDMLIPVEALNNSILIAQARGIIKEDKSSSDADPVYVFRTLFYYYAFCGGFRKMNELEESIFKAEQSQKQSGRWEQILEDFQNLSDAEQDDLLIRMYHRAGDVSRKGLLKDIGAGEKSSPSEVSRPASVANENRPLTLELSDHIQLFMITPYASEYKPVEEAVRKVFEQSPFWFEVRLARDFYESEYLVKNVRSQMASAHGFIAEISELSTNVMMEVGFLVMNDDPRPLFPLRARDATQEPPKDLGDLLPIPYTSRKLSTHDISDAIKEEIKSEILKDGRITHTRLRELYSNQSKKSMKHFLSRTLLENLEDVHLSDSDIKRIRTRYSTVEAFLAANESQLSALGTMKPLRTLKFMQETMREQLEEAQKNYGENS